MTAWSRTTWTFCEQFLRFCWKKRSLSNCRYSADRAQNLPGQPHIWLTLFQISFKSVHFRRSYCRTREGRFCSVEYLQYRHFNLGQRRRQEVPDIVARCRAELCTLAPRSCTARVLGLAASVVSSTHRWCGRVVAGGRWVVPPHWAPTAIGAPGRLGWRPVLHYSSRVASATECTRATTSIWNVAVGTARRIWRNWRRADTRSQHSQVGTAKAKVAKFCTIIIIIYTFV